MTNQMKAPGKRVTKEDVEIGTRIYKARVLRNKTKVDLAAAMDSSYQQLGKYESGINRVSATMLKKIAEYLDVDINYLLLCTDDPFGNRLPISNNEYEYRRHVLNLLDALENRSQKDAVIHLIETMVKKEEA